MGAGPGFLRAGLGAALPKAPTSRLFVCGLLDDRVLFLKGFFAETLPAAPVQKIALLRLDGDLYASTVDALVALYPKLQRGGFCIVDDYYQFEECRQAIDEYRDEHGIDDELVRIDNCSVYWRR